jgi:hypothetical protein
MTGVRRTGIIVITISRRTALTKPKAVAGVAGCTGIAIAACRTHIGSVATEAHQRVAEVDGAWI